MGIPYCTENQAKLIATEIAEEKSSEISSCVKKNTKSIPYTQTVGGSDSAFPNKNYVLKALYGQDGDGNTETIIPVVMGNDASTVDASYSHTIPIRDVDGRLYCYCYTSREGKSISADTEYMACNVGAVNFLINKKVPTIDSSAAEGTYVLKATKSGTTITYNWVKE